MGWRGGASLQAGSSCAPGYPPWTRGAAVGHVALPRLPALAAQVEGIPEEVIFDHLHATAFQYSPLGRTIRGPAENVRCARASARAPPPPPVPTLHVRGARST